MNNTAVKSGILIFYIFLLSKIMGFNIGLIVNVPFLIIVFSGSLLLALLCYRRGTGKKGFFSKLKYMSLVSGSFTTFFAHITCLSGNIADPARLYEKVVYNFLPLFYSFLFYFILDLVKFPMSGELKENDMDNEGIERLEDYDLTQREIAVAQEILMNLSNSAIAEKLYISENTVKKHIYHIFQKVGVKNRTEFNIKFSSSHKNS